MGEPSIQQNHFSTVRNSARRSGLGSGRGSESKNEKLTPTRGYNDSKTTKNLQKLDVKSGTVEMSVNGFTKPRRTLLQSFQTSQMRHQHATHNNSCS
mmetsp:Transcript_45248/g.60054  ORF Transcript_45248/g.60054 Transcript_45248/m.60054 type:complete len:97 (+) Transcript_45248:327-617(+)